MIRIKIFDKNENIIKELDIKYKDTVNERFKRKKSILDILLDNDINVRFGCMGGSCSACVTEVIKGINLINNEGVSRQIYRGVPEKHILTCISTIDKEEENFEGEIELKLRY